MSYDVDGFKRFDNATFSVAVLKLCRVPEIKVHILSKLLQKLRGYEVKPSRYHAWITEHLYTFVQA